MISIFCRSIFATIRFDGKIGFVKKKKTKRVNSSFSAERSISRVFFFNKLDFPVARKIEKKNVDMADLVREKTKQKLYLSDHKNEWW